MSEITNYWNIEKLKTYGFFELNEEKQVEFLREKGFFKLSNEEKIDFLEKAGLFYLDINDDPPAPHLEADKVDYLKTKPSSKVKNFIATKAGEYFAKKMLKNKSLIIENYNGLENMQAVKSGAIITCNHFNPFDSFSIELAFRKAGIIQNKKLFIIIREGNYTNFPGLYGFLFRNFDTLPLSSISKTMSKFLKAVDTILKRGDFILIFPEQSMWLNYKQPKPFKNGAYKFAVKNNVPIIPAFITMNNSNVIGKDGQPVQKYTLNFGEAIYSDSKLSTKQNIESMKNANYLFCKKTYEEFYGKPVKYKTIIHEDIPNYILSTPEFENHVITPNNKLDL